jgi:hypothetical protein
MASLLQARLIKLNPIKVKVGTLSQGWSAMSCNQPH